MRSRRTLAPLGAALVAGLALWGGPARAAFPESPDASAAKAKLTKIKVIVGRSRNALVGSVYSHKAGCVGARRARVFEVTGGRRSLLDSGSSMRRGAIGYFRLALGRFKWNQTYRIVTAPWRAAGLRCEGDRQTFRGQRLDCAGRVEPTPGRVDRRLSRSPVAVRHTGSDHKLWRNGNAGEDLLLKRARQRPGQGA